MHCANGRSRPRDSRDDDVPESSKSLFVARIASSADKTFASATAIEAAPTVLSFGTARASSTARPPRSSKASAACNRILRSPI